MHEEPIFDAAFAAAWELGIPSKFTRPIMEHAAVSVMEDCYERDNAPEITPDVIDAMPRRRLVA